MRERKTRTLRVRMTETEWNRMIRLCDRNNASPSETTRQMWGALWKDEERHIATYGSLDQITSQESP